MIRQRRRPRENINVVRAGEPASECASWNGVTCCTSRVLALQHKKKERSIIFASTMPERLFGMWCIFALASSSCLCVCQRSQCRRRLSLLFSGVCCGGELPLGVGETYNMQNVGKCLPMLFVTDNGTINTCTQTHRKRTKHARSRSTHRRKSIEIRRRHSYHLRTCDVVVVIVVIENPRKTKIQNGANTRI